MDGYMVPSDMVSRGFFGQAWRCGCGAWFGRFGSDGDAMGSGLRLVIWRAGPRGFHSFGSGFTVIFRVLHRPFGASQCRSVVSRELLACGVGEPKISYVWRFMGLALSIFIVLCFGCVCCKRVGELCVAGRS